MILPWYYHSLLEWVSCIIKVEWIDDPTQSMLINDFSMLYISLQCAEKMAFVAKNKSLKKGSKYFLNPSGQSKKNFLFTKY